MRHCRNCGSDGLELIKESHVRRGAREYVLHWYSCPGCGDVGFSYRRVSGPPMPERHGPATADAVPATNDQHPALSR